MIRLVPLLLFVALLAGCTTAGTGTLPAPADTACDPPPASTAASGGATSTAVGDHSTPEQAACTFYAHLRDFTVESCDVVLADVSADGLKALTDKAGSRDKLCGNLKLAHDEIVAGTQFKGVAKLKETGDSAQVNLGVCDNVKKCVGTVVDMLRENGVWKVKTIPFA